MNMHMSLKVIIHNKHDFIFAEEQAAKINGNAILFLQPEWSKKEEMTPLIVDYVMNNPKWRVSLQTHKYLKYSLIINQLKNEKITISSSIYAGCTIWQNADATFKADAVKVLILVGCTQFEMLTNRHRKKVGCSC